MATADTLKLDRRPDGVLSLQGVLGFGTVTSALESSRALLVPGTATRVDLAGVSRADSAGIALLVEWLKVARQARGSVVFENMTAQLSALAFACGVQELLSPAPASAVEAAKPAAQIP